MVDKTLLSKKIERTIVSTDSEEYAKIALDAGAEVPFLRPKKFSDDYSTDYDFIRHAIDFLDLTGDQPDYIAHIRPTTPYRRPELLDQAISAFCDNENSSALRSVHAMSESAYKTLEITSSGFLKQIGSEGTELDAANDARFPITYFANGYIDVLSTRFIKKQKITWK